MQPTAKNRIPRIRWWGKPGHRKWCRHPAAWSRSGAELLSAADTRTAGPPVRRRRRSPSEFSPRPSSPQRSRRCRSLWRATLGRIHPRRALARWSIVPVETPTLGPAGETFNRFFSTIQTTISNIQRDSFPVERNVKSVIGQIRQDRKQRRWKIRGRDSPGTF